MRTLFNQISVIVSKETLTKRSAVKGKDEKKIGIKVRFAATVARWARERQHYGLQAEETVSDGVIMSYEVHNFSEIAAWILGWGAEAEVLSPKELRKSLREIAQKLAELLT